MFRKLAIIICFALASAVCHAQNVMVSGTVSDAETGEALIGASVYSTDNRYGQTTDIAGFFELHPTVGETINIVVSYVGYTSYSTQIKADKNSSFDIRLTRDNKLRDVTIYAPSQVGIRATQMSANALSVRQIKSLPATLGEVDVLKALQTLPGIQTGNDGTAGIYVRGGSYDQNQISIDGFTIYNPEHLKGFVSAFSPEMVSDVTVLKGGFPARYGSRLSSVVDVSLRDGDFDRYHGSLSAGVMSSAIHAEGPIWKGHTSFSVSARASYLNALVIPTMKRVIDNQTVLTPYLDLNYYDITARLVHRFSASDRLSATFYFGNDKDNVSPSSWSAEKSKYNSSALTTTYYTQNSQSSTDSNWGNIIGGLSWIHSFNSKLQMNASAGFSTYNYSLAQSQTDHKFWSFKEDISDGIKNDKSLDAESYARYHSKISDLSVNADFTHNVAPRQTLRYGASFKLQHLSPTVDVYNHTTITYFQKGKANKETITDERIGNSTDISTFSVYAEDEWSIASWLKANVGLRYALYSSTDATTHSLEPRASVSIMPTSNLAIKLSYARMSQGLHLLTSGNLVMPSDIWVPSTKKIPVTYSDQVAAGVGYEIIKGLSFEVEGYYKWMKNLVEYKDGASFFSTAGDWQDMVACGSGRAYGAEFMLKKESGNTTGWVSYTWSKSLRTFDTPLQEINGGKEFPAANDRRHSVNIVISHRFNKHWNASLSWTYRSGRRGNVATTVISGGRIDEYDPVGDITSSSSTFHIIGGFSSDDPDGAAYFNRFSRFYSYRGRNSFKMPDEHHLDLRLTYTLRHRRCESGFGLSLYNVYNHKNVTDIYVSYRDSEPYLKGVCKLPFLPSIDYTIKF